MTICSQINTHFIATEQMKCYRCSTHCGPEAPDFTGGCPTDSFVDLDMCHLQCGGAPPPPPSPPPPGPSPSDINKMRDQVIRAHSHYRDDSVYEDSNGKLQYPNEIKWDEKLADSAASWVRYLTENCGDERLMDKGPGQNVTKVTGASNPLYYSWSDVVNNWLYEGCKGKPLPSESASEQSRLYGHYMTATLKEQGAVGCASSFVSTCPATGKSLQVYVCDYERSAQPVTALQGNVTDYPRDPMVAPLCSLAQPFPVKQV